MEVNKPCGHCGKPEGKQRCSRCKVVYYCGRECQQADWKEHKKTCQPYCPTGGQESGHMSVLYTPRLQHTSPPQHTAYGTPTVSPMLQPTAAMMFSPSFHMGNEFELDNDVEETSSESEDHFSSADDEEF